MDRSELKEVIAATNERTGSNFSESDVDRQLTERANVRPGPSNIQKYVETHDDKYRKADGQ